MNAHALQLRMYIVYNCSSKQILLTPFKMSWYQTLEDVISRVVTGFIVSLHAVGTFQNHPPSFFYYCHSYFNLIWPKSIGRGISSDCENVGFFCQNRFRGRRYFYLLRNIQPLLFCKKVTISVLKQTCLLNSFKFKTAGCSKQNGISPWIKRHSLECKTHTDCSNINL